MDEAKLNLIINSQKGDKIALSELIKLEQNNIYTTLFYLKKDNNDLYDIMQNVLVKMTTKISTLKNPMLFKTWLNRIIVNTYFDYTRKMKKNFKILKQNDNINGEIADYTSNPQNRILYNELDFVIKKSIENLPNQYKIPITLREIQGLSYEDISQITKTTIGTVKSRISRARGKIKNDIAKYTKN